MAILIMEGNDRIERVEETSFIYEKRLQEYVATNPDIIPVYDINEDTKLLIVAREFSTMSGPIDALGFDNKGNIYVVETKLFNNPESRRKVIAQVLDYGASLWKNSNNFRDFINRLNAACEKTFNQTFEEKYSDFCGVDDISEILQRIENNLDEGIIKFVVLVDKLHDQVKNLAMFVNQNSKFDLYLVEIQYYKHDKFEIIIPKIYGAEVKKEISTKTSRVIRKWDEKSFFDEVDNNHELVNEKQKDAVHKLWDWANKYNTSINWGTSKTYGSFGPAINGLTHGNCSLFTTTIDSWTYIRYPYLKKQEDKIKLRNLLSKNIGDAVPKVTHITDKELYEIHPIIKASIMPQIVDGVICALEEFMEWKEDNEKNRDK